MKLTKAFEDKLSYIRRLGFCPALLNLYAEKYSLNFLLNDIFSGLRIFLLVFPIALSLAFFCGVSPIQGVVSCAIASVVSVILGGSKYQISTISIPICVITFDIMTKYQYKGLLVTSVFVSIILLIFGILRISSVLRHLSYSFISALTIYVLFCVLVNQIQYILDINTIQSSQGLLDNFNLLKDNFDNVTSSGIITCISFILPLIVLKMFFKGFKSYFLYIILSMVVVYITNTGIIPGLIEIKTVSKDIISNKFVENIFTISRSVPSQVVLSNALSYAFVIALVIATKACYCTSVSSSITGDRRLQVNIELISSGVSNFLSVAFGGVFVSSNTSFSLKNIQFKSKSILSILTFAALLFVLIIFSDFILRYIPIYSLSSILLVYSASEIFRKKLSKYLNFKSNDSYIFIVTFIASLYFGFVSAVIIGFTISCIFFAKRLIMVKDATVHTTKNHDIDAFNFMSKKNGFLIDKDIPDYILNKIEVIQIYNILFLNITEAIEESLKARGAFPSVLIVYFKNVPFLDKEALESLKNLVKRASKENCIVMVSGTNGMLLDILTKKTENGNSGNIFGYVIPSFDEAINQTVKRLKTD